MSLSQRHAHANVAERLKAETRALHTTVERSLFFGELLHGRLQRPAYCALLRNLHAIYAVLEPALVRHALHPRVAPVFIPALWRTRALELDLLALYGPGWANGLALLPAAADYAARLRDLAAWRPGLLVAHAYVRYLGDLSGGQMLRQVVAPCANLQGVPAVAFYNFGDARVTHDLTQALRRGLAALPLDDQQASDLVDEARLAFVMHQRLFEELALACGLGAAPTAGLRGFNLAAES